MTQNNDKQITKNKKSDQYWLRKRKMRFNKIQIDNKSCLKYS